MDDDSSLLFDISHGREIRENGYEEEPKEEQMLLFDWKDAEKARKAELEKSVICG